MRRGGMVAFIGVFLWVLPAFPGCNWSSTRRSARDALSPEKAAQARMLGERAQQAVDSGDLPTAEAILNQLVSIAPASPEGYQRLAAVQVLLGRPGQAEVGFLKALELDSDYAAALVGLARLEAASGRLDSALKRLESAVELEPNDAAAHLALAEVLQSTGKTDDALAACFRALEADPFLAEANRRIAAVQLARDEADQALVRLDQTLETSPGDAEALYLRGRAHLALQHVGPAVDDLRNASQRLPNRPEVHLALAQALDAARLPADALQAVEAVLRLSPNDAEARTLGERLRR